MESIEHILAREATIDTKMQKRIMRRVYGAYVMSIVTNSGFVHGITLSVAGGSLYSMTTPSAIMTHILQVKVGEFPGYVAHILMSAPLVKTALLALFTASCIMGLYRCTKYLRTIRVPYMKHI